MGAFSAYSLLAIAWLTRWWIVGCMTFNNGCGQHPDEQHRLSADRPETQSNYALTVEVP